MEKIIKIAEKLGLSEEDIELYGNYMAKLQPKNNPVGSLILVSAMSPTSTGEGKTTVSIGLSDALSKLGKKSILSLREPSLGPVFGLKGGATGGGGARIEPSDEINLHFTGDMHAITSANNLLCAIIDNSLFQGNPLEIDPDKIYFKRCIDMNDRALREVEISTQGLKGESPRKESFVITAASEIMTLLCLSKDFGDLKTRLGNILVAHSRIGKPIFAKELGVTDAMAALLIHAVKPNLVQTSEGNPAIVHGGPFANIAHGCSSLIATKTALSLGEYCVTEAGFGGDLGGEKFLDIVCRQNNIAPRIVVIVATIKALKAHSSRGDINEGFENLKKHIENFKNVFNQNVVVALNLFDGDTDEEIGLVKKLCSQINVNCFSTSQFTQGGKGCLELAKFIISECEKKPNELTHPYDLQDDITTKIEKLAKTIYGSKEIVYSMAAKEDIKSLSVLGKGLPIVVAKTPNSFSDAPKKIGLAKDNTLHVEKVELQNGSGFIVVKTGKINLMPGLGKNPNAENIKVDKDFKITNLK